MTIPAQMSLHGFIATAPQLTFTGNGTARFYARAGVEHYRKESDGTFTRLESTFHALVAFDKTAERAYAQFRVGDSFIASGYINSYEIGRDGGTQAREEFVARRVGHDVARTKYDVDRTPSRQPDPPTTDLPNAVRPNAGPMSPGLQVAQDPAPAVGL